MSLSTRRRFDREFKWLCAGTAFLGVGLLGILFVELIQDGAPHISRSLFFNFPSRFPDQAGIKAALVGTLWLVTLTAFMSIPIGIGAGIYLEEFAKKNRFNRIVNLNIANLAGVPSIVYGMLGLVIFVRGLHWERSLLSGAATMSLLILPTIILATQEALRSVPNSLRYAAFALGGTRWQAVRDHVFPSALPGILTGIILAIARAMGETAPLIMIGALTYLAFLPKSPLDAFSALPIQIFNWASRPQEAFHHLASATILVLLAVLLFMNSVAIILRIRHQKRQKW